MLIFVAMAMISEIEYIDGKPVLFLPSKKVSKEDKSTPKKIHEARKKLASKRKAKEDGKIIRK